MYVWRCYGLMFSTFASTKDPPSAGAMLKENEAILKSRSDGVKKEKRDNRKWLDSCVESEHDC